MTRYERHPAPEKLLLQITTEAVNLLALGTPDKPADVSLLETGAALTVKAWELPQELADSSAALIQHQKELLATASGRAALPDDQLLECYDDRRTDLGPVRDRRPAGRCPGSGRHPTDGAPAGGRPGLR